MKQCINNVCVAEFRSEIARACSIHKYQTGECIDIKARLTPTEKRKSNPTNIKEFYKFSMRKFYLCKTDTMVRMMITSFNRIMSGLAIMGNLTS